MNVNFPLQLSQNLILYKMKSITAFPWWRSICTGVKLTFISPDTIVVILRWPVGAYCIVWYRIASLGGAKFPYVQRLPHLFKQWPCYDLYSIPLAAIEAGELACSSALGRLEKLGASTPHNYQQPHRNPYRSRRSAPKPCLPNSRCGNF
jgi:hypothetical protein